MRGEGNSQTLARADGTSRRGSGLAGEKVARSESLTVASSFVSAPAQEGTVRVSEAWHSPLCLQNLRGEAVVARFVQVLTERSLLRISGIGSGAFSGPAVAQSLSRATTASLGLIERLAPVG